MLPGVLDNLRVDWQRTGRGRQARRALDHLRDRAINGGQPDLVPWRWRDLCDLVDGLEPRAGLTVLDRARVLALLLACAPDDPLVNRCLLQALLPGIIGVCRRLRFGQGAVDDDVRGFVGDAITEMVALLNEWAGDIRPYAGPDLLSALHCRMRRRIIGEDERRAEIIPPPVWKAEPDDDWRELASMIDLSDRDGRLLYCRVVLGHTLTELAAVEGTDTTTLRKRLMAVAEPMLEPV